MSTFCLGVSSHVHPVGYRLMRSFLDTAPSDAPVSFDKTNGANGFQMLGNGPDSTLTVNNGNPVGDCGYVMTVNNVYVDSCETNEPFTFPSSNDVVSDYLRYNHGVDQGVVNAQLFQYWHKVGLPWGGRLVGSAGVNFHDWDESWAYIYAFGGGSLAITVTEGMQQATQNGQPWDVISPDDQVMGGHDVFVFARQDADTGVLATWGQRQLFTKGWWEQMVQELDVTITDRQAARKGDGFGLSLDKLEAYMNSLGAVT